MKEHQVQLAEILAYYVTAVDTMLIFPLSYHKDLQPTY